MIALFRTTAAFFIAVLIVFVLITQLARMDPEPEIRAELVFEQFDSQIEKVRQLAADRLDASSEGVFLLEPAAETKDVLFFDVQNEDGLLFRMESPLLREHPRWSMEPVSGGDLPRVGKARLTLPTDKGKREIECYIIRETVYDQAENPVRLSVYFSASGVDS